MQKHDFVVGIDVSKKTIDACISAVSKPSSPNLHQCFSNNEQGHKELIVWVQKLGYKPQQGLYVMEHTGLYSFIVCVFLQKNEFPFCCCAGLDIKYSNGKQRGKTDKADAQRIARYAIRNLDDLEEQKLKSDVLLRLQLLYNERRRLVKCQKVLSADSGERAALGLGKSTSSSNALEGIKKDIKLIEKQMKAIIKEDKDLSDKAKLCKSVPGIGDILTVYLLIVTNGFTSFEDSRKLACYAGVAPFAYQSGSSIKGKTRVNDYADKELKQLLHMGAISAKKHDRQIGAYYDRKKAEGKHGQVVINAIKNKLLARVMAVVRRGTPYVPMETYRAEKRA